MKRKKVTKSEPQEFYGIGVSSGIAIGRVYLMEPTELKIVKRHIKSSDIKREIQRINDAVKRSINQLNDIKAQMQKDNKEVDHSFIINTYLMLLEDPVILKKSTEIITKEKVNAEWALRKTIDTLKDMVYNIDDEYLLERKHDIEYVGRRILRNLMKIRVQTTSHIRKKVIVVAHDLSPAETAQMNKEKVMGFITDVGGRTSHTAIMAKALGIPAVLGLENISKKVNHGDTIIVDALEGKVILNPTRQQFGFYLNKHQTYKYRKEELLRYRHLEAKTQDGYVVKIDANIELPSEIPTVIEQGGEGIGLYRTEFLYLNRKVLPTEEEHFKIYKEVLQGIKPKTATIRTFDLGGDKFLSHMEVPEEINPALGLRGIRMGFYKIELLKTQIRALFRASVFGSLRIMFPLISGLEEIRRVKEIIEEVKEELKKDGIPYASDIKLGSMIEVPSAAIITDIIAKEVDFLSIGTNDLIQYSLAIDRVNKNVSYLYNPLHPAVLRTIKYIVECAKSANIEVGICGEMAGDELYTLVLLGLGLNELSMNPQSIPMIKYLIRSYSMEEAKKLVEEFLTKKTAEEIEELLKEKMASLFPDFFVKCPKCNDPNKYIREID